MADIYSRRFKNFHHITLCATKVLMMGWKDLSDTERWERMDDWLLNTSYNYGMSKPALGIDPHAQAGYYVRGRNEIHMAYPSIITLLHEFRHAMQDLAQVRMIDDDVEIDARAWSLSLYRKVAPNTYRRLIEDGMVLHV